MTQPAGKFDGGIKVPDASKLMDSNGTALPLVKASDMQSALSALSTVYQPIDADLTAIAALTTTSYGRALLSLANQAALQSSVGIGGAALLNVGTTAGTVAAGDDSRVQSIQNPKLLKSHSKLVSLSAGTATNLKLLSWSDSMNGLGGGSAYTLFAGALTQAYGDAGAGISPTVSVAGAATAADASASSNPASYTRWPTGLPNCTTGLNGTVTWGRGGSTAYCDTIKIYYVKESGAGSFKVQTSTDFSTWTDEGGYTSVDASNGSMVLGIITISKTLGFYGVRLVGISGTVYYPYVRFIASTVASVEPISIALGGLALTNCNLAPASVWGAFIADVNPDLCMFEMKESAAGLATDLPLFWTNFTTYCSDADWIFIGSTPVQTNDSDMVAQNLITRTHAVTYNKQYLDAYNLFGASWTLANAQGLMGDGVHRSGNGNEYVAAALLKVANAFGVSAAVTPWGIRSTRRIRTSGGFSLAISGYRSGQTDLVNLQPASSVDAEALLNRDLNIKDSAGNLIGSFGTSNSGLQVQVARRLQIGTDGTIYGLVSQSSGTRIAFGHMGNGSLTGTSMIAGSFLGSQGIGYVAGGSTITQITSRTTGVTINGPTGLITLVSTAGSTSWQTMVVSNTSVTAKDSISISQVSGTDVYIWTTRVAANSFSFTFATTGGTTTEQPSFQFNVVKGATT